VGFLPDPADHHQRFAEISLGMARGVVQRDKHLPPAAQLIAHVILDDGVAAGEPVLVSKPIKNPLGRVALLAVLANVVAQPLVDDLGNSSSLGRLIGAVRRYPGGTEKLSIFFTLSREIPK